MKTRILLIILLFVSVFACKKKEETGGPLTLNLTSSSICLSMLKTDVPDSTSCVELSFNNVTNELTMKHFNAGFNCCPEEFYVDYTLNGDTITITESEKSSLCDCNCLYNLEMKMSGLSDKTYRIRFVEPYRGDQEAIDFMADLANNSSITHCVLRTRYPWKNW